MTVHGFVGVADESFDRIAGVVGRGSDGGAQVDFLRFGRGAERVLAIHPFFDTCGEGLSFAQLARDDDQEFVATPPADFIGGAEYGAQLLGELPQKIVAGDVAMGIVDVFEAVGPDRAR